MINPEIIKRLQIFSKDLHGSEFDFGVFTERHKEGTLKGLPKRKRNVDFKNLIFALIRNENEFSNQFWICYVKASIASTKLNSTFTVDQIATLIENTEERFKKTRSEKDEELLISLLEFISTNSLLSSGSEGLISSAVELPEGHLAGAQTINQKFLKESILKGRNLLFSAMHHLYGLTSLANYSNMYGNFPTKQQLDNLAGHGLLENMGDISWSEGLVKPEAGLNDEEASMKISNLEYGTNLIDIERALRIFKNRMAYVRVNTVGEYLPNFSQIWDFNNLTKPDKTFLGRIRNIEKESIAGSDAYQGIIDSLEHLQSSLIARSDICWNTTSINLENLRLIAGLDNVKSLKNELSQKDTILEESRETNEEVTTESALKWLNDPKRRKASFYSALDEAVDINIDETRKIYLSEINS